MAAVTLAALATLTAGCGSTASHASDSPAGDSPRDRGPVASHRGLAAGPAGPAAVARAAAITGAMSVPEKVGQLLVATVPGTAASDGGAHLVRQYHLGGVIYFRANLRTAAQVAAFSNGLQRSALGRPPRGAPGRARQVPLLIGTDQEGGIVSRMAGIATVYPNQMAAGATRDPELISQQERATGRQLRAVGINLDYAPVADVNTDPANPVIGVRSFGADPELVATMTAAAIAGFHAAGEAVSAKHFPGHGGTSTDSHHDLPVVHRTLRQWWQTDAPPFQAAIRAGADQIMVGHLDVPALDRSGLPASLSPRIVTGMLRDQLGYQGVIVTDSLRMAGVLQGRSSAEAAVMAVAAGADQVLMPASVPAAFRALLAAVRAGRISMDRLDASVTRIIALKAARGVLDHPLVDAAAAPGHQNTGADRETATRQARHSVTLVVNRETSRGRRALPLTGRKVYLAGPEAGNLAGPLRAALASSGGQLVSRPSAAQAIVLATRSAAADPAQRRLAGRLAATGHPVIVVATGVPYDVGLLRRAAAGLATYSSAPASLAAAAGVLAGTISPHGRLPVTIPGSGGAGGYRYGTGLRYQGRAG